MTASAGAPHFGGHPAELVDRGCRRKIQLADQDAVRFVALLAQFHEHLLHISRGFCFRGANEEVAESRRPGPERTRQTRTAVGALETFVRWRAREQERFQ